MILLCWGVALQRAFLSLLQSQWHFPIPDSVFAPLPFQTEKLESYKTQKLDSISPELVQAKELLQGITVPRRGCLKELAQQKEFVCWVREALKGVCCSSRN